VPATLFVDENLRRGFRLVGVVVTTGEIGRARATMRAQLPRGARRVHFVKENDARRHHILRVIAALHLDTVVVEVHEARRTPDARRAAVATLVGWALRADVTRLVFERDDNSVALDQRTIAHTLVSAGARGSLEYDHVAASTEPLLWIPDALAWAWSRGDDWRRAVEAIGATVIRP